MGYRSDVVIAVRQKGFNEIVKSIKDFAKSPDGYDFRPDWIVTDDDDVFYIGFNCVKWYAGCYDDVNCVMSAVKKLTASDNEEDACQLVRIGEEYGDIEIISNDSGYSLNVYPVTSISIPEGKDVDFREVFND